MESHIRSQHRLKPVTYYRIQANQNPCKVDLDALLPRLNRVQIKFKSMRADDDMQSGQSTCAFCLSDVLDLQEHLKSLHKFRLHYKHYQPGEINLKDAFKLDDSYCKVCKCAFKSISLRDHFGRVHRICPSVLDSTFSEAQVTEIVEEQEVFDVFSHRYLMKNAIPSQEKSGSARFQAAAIGETIPETNVVVEASLYDPIVNLGCNDAILSHATEIYPLSVRNSQIEMNKESLSKFPMYSTERIELVGEHESSNIDDLIIAETDVDAIFIKAAEDDEWDILTPLQVGDCNDDMCSRLQTSNHEVLKFDVNSIILNEDRQKITDLKYDISSPEKPNRECTQKCQESLKLGPLSNFIDFIVFNINKDLRETDSEEPVDDISSIESLSELSIDDRGPPKEEGYFTIKTTCGLARFPIKRPPKL